MLQFTIRNFDFTLSNDFLIWKQLGLEWLQGYEHSAGYIPYLLEEDDFISLNYPVENVIDPGGQIWFAEVDNFEVVGTIGLMPHHHEWELIKLAVKPVFQGNGIGKALIQHAIDHAKKKGIKKLTLDSNSHLKTAVNLYEYFGFRFIPPRGQFVTADVAMELALK
jgi:putative acetyltransferase